MGKSKFPRVRYVVCARSACWKYARMPKHVKQLCNAAEIMHTKYCDCLCARDDTCGHLLPPSSRKHLRYIFEAPAHGNACVQFCMSDTELRSKIGNRVRVKQQEREYGRKHEEFRKERLECLVCKRSKSSERTGE
eukprot:6210563-Pleurochrysis_carterae.AAC.1